MSKVKREKIKINKEDYLMRMRHSCNHVLAQAIMKLYKGVNLGIGPAIQNGFYYDFEFPKGVNVSENDFVAIEKEMNRIVQEDQIFKKSFKPVDESLEFLEKEEQPLKVELVQDLKKAGEENVSFYQNGPFIDLCSGPHISSSKEIGPFKLLSIAGAYWKGDEKNKQLQRIYGVCFESQEELDQYLWRVEEAKKRDHRKLGRELELFMLSDEVGPGLLIWLPKGAVIKREIEKLMYMEQEKREYKHVASPHIGKKNLWVKSGHWKLYRDKMYSPMQIDNVEYLVKPMSCPMHIQVYKNVKKSYKDLPYRIAEIASVYRYEQSGELSGMARARYFNQDDAHIFCRPDQVKDEIIGVLDFIEMLYGIFGLKDLEFWLSVRGDEKQSKYLGDDKVWNQAEEALKLALEEKSIPYIRAEGEAKFYGPGIDVRGFLPASTSCQKRRRR